jgi:DNA-directed RNA polymerase subunit E'/Rpb7
MATDNTSTSNCIGEKEISTTVRIMPGEHSNINKAIKDKLEKRFVGKCFSECYIISIEHITERGMILVDKNSRGGKCNVDIRFKVKYIKYNPGDVVCNTKILKINDGKIVIRNPYLTGLIYMPNVSNVFKEGNYIPVMITSSKYYIGHESNVASCELLGFPKPIYYRLKNDPKKIDTDSYSKLEVGATEYNKLKKYDNVVSNHYKKDIKGTIKKLNQFSTLKEGDIIGRPQYLSRFEGFAVLDKSVKDIPIVDQSSQIVFNELLDDYVKYTNLYRAMDELYNAADFKVFENYYK